MSARLTKFESFKTHAMHKNLFIKLKKEDIERCVQFIRENDHLDKNEYASKANRWMLDQPKPKQYSAMWALVLQSNVEDL